MNPERLVRDTLTSPIYDLARETPLTVADRLSAQLGCKILLKREDMQPIFSFKVRGAYHKMLRLGSEKGASGVVAASAGNHAQGVAISARKLGLPAHIFMPRPVQQIKIDAVRALGGKVSLRGDSFEETLKHATSYAERTDMTLFHPYDDYDIIAGQGTVGAEILRALRSPVDALFIPTGGGGLLAGLATVIKSLRPQIKVIGVEPTDSACMGAAFSAGRLVSLPYVGTFAETVAVRKAGRKTFALCRKFVDAMITVDTGSICAAIKDIYENTRVIVEPAGALGVAGARAWTESGRGNGTPLVAVLSGANMNFDSLRYIVERAIPGSQKVMLLAASIPEQPGSFLRICQILGKRTVTEFNYRYSCASKAYIFAGLAINGLNERAQIIDSLSKEGITALDMTDDETAALHVRHMVGGRAQLTSPELIYRLEFPERTGALMHFLKNLDRNWNISLFHYRSHGADYSRVLVGLQIGKSSRTALEKCFAKIGYDYWLIKANKAYDMFLADPESDSQASQ